VATVPQPGSQLWYPYFCSSLAHAVLPWLTVTPPVFSKKNGGRPDAKWVYAVFSTAAFRLTGKRTNPHLIRDMIVTFLRDTDVRHPPSPSLRTMRLHNHSVRAQSIRRRRSVSSRRWPYTWVTL
jgi:hypothetical protein